VRAKYDFTRNVDTAIALRVDDADGKWRDELKVRVILRGHRLDVLISITVDYLWCGISDILHDNNMTLLRHV
jgi:hypothetical protein